MEDIRKAFVRPKHLISRRDRHTDPCIELRYAQLIIIFDKLGLVVHSSKALYKPKTLILNLNRIRYL